MTFFRLAPTENGRARHRNWVEPQQGKEATWVTTPRHGPRRRFTGHPATQRFRRWIDSSVTRSDLCYRGVSQAERPRTKGGKLSLYITPESGRGARAPPDPGRGPGPGPPPGGPRGGPSWGPRKADGGPGPLAAPGAGTPYLRIRGLRRRAAPLASGGRAETTTNSSSSDPDVLGRPGPQS